jgi:hypothetical protein
MMMLMIELPPPNLYLLLLFFVWVMDRQKLVKICKNNAIGSRCSCENAMKTEKQKEPLCQSNCDQPALNTMTEREQDDRKRTR